jgi:hypothetical protein
VVRTANAHETHTERRLHANTARIPSTCLGAQAVPPHAAHRKKVTMTRPATAYSNRPVTYGLFYARAFVSMMMIAFLVAFTVSGVALFVAPSGQMATTIGWTLIGLGKGQWEALHIAFGFLWIPLAVVHLVINRRVVSGYLRDRARKAFVWRRELLAAVVVTVSLAVASIRDSPPVAQLMAFEERFTDVWAARSPDVVALPRGAGAAAQGGGVGRHAVVDPQGGELQPVGKEAAARAAAAAQADTPAVTD